MLRETNDALKQENDNLNRECAIVTEKLNGIKGLWSTIDAEIEMYKKEVSKLEIQNKMLLDKLIVLDRMVV